MGRDYPFYRDPRVVFACRVFLGSFFLFASFDKILDPKQFAIDVENYKLIPLWSTNLFAMILPWVELVCGLLLVAGVWVRSASFCLSVMLVVFIVALISAIARGLDIECGCYHGAKGSLRWDVMRDLVLLWMTGHILVRGPGYRLSADESS